MEYLQNKFLFEGLAAFFLLLIIFAFGFLTFSSPIASAGEGGEEIEALLKWKSTLHYPTSSPLSSWTNFPSLSSTRVNETSPCTWAGITCQKSRTVTHINLTACGIRGTLHGLSFSSLPNLQGLDLSYNLLYGTLPQQIGTLELLLVLDLSENRLTGSLPGEIGMLKSLLQLQFCKNEFKGSIPTSLGNLSKLLVLELCQNKLSGSIPKEIGMLKSLRALSLTRNELRGSIPNSIGNLSNLFYLFLDDNKLSGSIPREIGMLKSLRELCFNENELTGSIPTSFGNMSNLFHLFLYTNKISGPIPQEIGMLRHLGVLDLSTNHLSGSIPTSIGNMDSLTLIYLSVNNLLGSIPSTIGNMTSLIDLGLADNQLSGHIPRELGKLKTLNFLRLFMNKLTGSVPLEMNNLTNFKALYLGNNMLYGYLPQKVCHSGLLEKFSANENNFWGPVPKSLRNCSSLIRVRLEKNQLTGNISEDFGVYPHLDYIDLSYNKLYGELSQKWGQRHNLTSLKISNNRISGTIPNKLGELDQLRTLDLSSNHLVHAIPKEFGRLTSLVTLELNDNRISDSVPSEVGMLTNLEHLNLASNSLSGLVPKQLQGCKKLLYLNLSNNRFNQSLPHEIGSLEFLENLDVSHNLISGEIPHELGEMNVLESLNLSHNRLSGSIPTFDEMSSLTTVDVSYNWLEGSLPNNEAFRKAPVEALEKNKGLCGNNATASKACPASIGTEKPNSNKGKKIIVSFVIPLLGILFLLFSAFGFFIIICSKRKDMNNKPRGSQNGDLFVIWSHNGKLVHENIIEATEEFNLKHCIGVGASGSVYKAELPTGQVVAVKKLHSLEDSEMVNLKAFSSEIRALTEIRHRNIVKLLGFCSHVQYLYLIYEFLEGGSLDALLGNDEIAMKLGWTKRVNILKGVANALAYMHHDCLPSIIHRDISSKNILLDSEYEACLSDFGTARVLEVHSSVCTSIAGTFGYTAPELAYTVKLSEKCDVYSFGVLALEVIMGGDPRDLLSNLLSSTCHQISLKDVLDPRLSPPDGQVMQELVLATQQAMACLRGSPQSRPTMRQVSQELSNDRRRPVFQSLNMISLGQLVDL
ncbi:hypothetical protein LguiB_017543 [Lonicera macranthoides]